jgi:CBS-domain-containing membrane protein
MAELEVGKLQIHVRRVVSGDGRLESANEIFCPQRDRTLPLSECEACDDYGGSGLELDGKRTYVLCRRLTSESARTLRGARHAYVGRRVTPGQGSVGERTRISAIMTTDVLCVREDLPLVELKRLLFARGISGAPVVNERGEPIGVVSQRDLLSADENGVVTSAMTRLTFTLPDSASVSQAAALMSFEGIHRLPIVSEDGKVVGIVSSLDILRWLARVDGYLMPERR